MCCFISVHTFLSVKDKFYFSHLHTISASLGFLNFLIYTNLEYTLMVTELMGRVNLISGSHMVPVSFR